MAFIDAVPLLREVQVSCEGSDEEVRLRFAQCVNIFSKRGSAFNGTLVGYLLG